MCMWSPRSRSFVLFIAGSSEIKTLIDEWTDFSISTPLGDRNRHLFKPSQEKGLSLNKKESHRNLRTGVFGFLGRAGILGARTRGSHHDFNGNVGETVTQALHLYYTSLLLSHIPDALKMSKSTMLKAPELSLLLTSISSVSGGPQRNAMVSSHPTKPGQQFLSLWLLNQLGQSPSQVSSPMMGQRHAMWSWVICCLFNRSHLRCVINPSTQPL